MAALIGTGASGLFNAFAFTGMSFLFRMINNDGYKKEVARHNHAMESLYQAKELWQENLIKHKNKIQDYERLLSSANHDIVLTNRALDQLREIKKITYEGKSFTKEPVLEDYYTPSKEAQTFKTIAVGTSGLVGGWAVSKALTYAFG